MISLEVTKHPTTITIICPPCNICERIKILCALCEFKMNNIECLEKTPTTCHSAFIIQPTNFEKNIWKITINMNFSNNTILGEENFYESGERFLLPDQEKEFLICLNELKNLLIKNTMLQSSGNTNNGFMNVTSQKELFSNITKSNYDKRIIIFSSTSQQQTTTLLCVEIAKFLATRNQKVCIVDYTINNEISAFINLQYDFQINDNQNNILVENLSENTPILCGTKTSNGVIKILGNNNLKPLHPPSTRFLETLYDMNDYVLVNIGIYNPAFEKIYNKYNHVLNVQNNIVNISFLEKILLTDERISHLIIFEKPSSLLQKITRITNKPLVVCKPVKSHKIQINVKQKHENIIKSEYKKQNLNKQILDSSPEIKISKTYNMDTKSNNAKKFFSVNNKTKLKEKTYMNICALKSYPHF